MYKFELRNNISDLNRHYHEAVTKWSNSPYKNLKLEIANNIKYIAEPQMIQSQIIVWYEISMSKVLKIVAIVETLRNINTTTQSGKNEL